MKPNESAQIEFIKDCLRKGMQRKDIFAKFGNKWQKVASRTFDSRLKIAKDSIQQEIKEIKTQTKAIVQKEVNARKAKILTVFEKQEILTKIARGSIRLKKAMVVNKMIEFVVCVPDYRDRNMAIQELNKMHGDYAPERKHVTINKAGLDAIEEIYE